MRRNLFITGIGTDVGKTIAAAIVCESLQADYWKPVQAGDVTSGDKHTVRYLLSNTNSQIHENTYSLETPVSPHAAAKIDNVTILPQMIEEPTTENQLVIEGAGGILVPLNTTDTILDLIKPDYHIIVVSRHYLGSINHSLLTIKLLQDKGYRVSIIFSGDENYSSEDIIIKMTGANVIGRVAMEKKIDKAMVLKYADKFRDQLRNL